MIEDLMNSFVKSAVVGNAIMTNAGSVLYDDYTPPAATYLQDISAPPVAPESPDDNAFTKTEVSSPVIYSHSVIVDRGAVGPPTQDDYPRGPQPDATSNVTSTNYGLVKHN